jgi:hypothetical protein
VEDASWLVTEAQTSNGPADVHHLPGRFTAAFVFLVASAYATGGRNLGAIRLIKNRTRNTKNNTWAIELAVPASPPKPSAAAIRAITKNVSAQLNMLHHPFSETI